MGGDLPVRVDSMRCVIVQSLTWPPWDREDAPAASPYWEDLVTLAQAHQLFLGGEGAVPPGLFTTLKGLEIVGFDIVPLQEAFPKSKAWRFQLGRFELRTQGLVHRPSFLPGGLEFLVVLGATDARNRTYGWMKRLEDIQSLTGPLTLPFQGWKQAFRLVQVRLNQVWMPQGPCLVFEAPRGWNLPRGSFLGLSLDPMSLAIPGAHGAMVVSQLEYLKMIWNFSQGFVPPHHHPQKVYPRSWKKDVGDPDALPLTRSRKCAPGENCLAPNRGGGVGCPVFERENAPGLAVHCWRAQGILPPLGLECIKESAYV
jgi:hypothetical protein